MIIDPGSRRGYTVVEGLGAGYNPLRTFIESFRPRHPAVPPSRGVVDLPITVGTYSSVQRYASYSGEVVHAVDPVAHRIYLPMTRAQVR